MKRISDAFFSMITTGTLLLVFAVVIAFATFIENDFGTAAAKMAVYNAWWFELLLFILAVNLLGSIVVNKLLTKEKWPVALFHLSFVVILAGAAITRYYGFEGTLHIREGQHNNVVVSRNTFLNIQVDKGDKGISSNEKVHFAPGMKNRFRKRYNIDGSKVRVTALQFIPSATLIPVEDPSGVPMIDILAVDTNDQPVEFTLKKEDKRTVDDIIFNFSSVYDSSAVNIFVKNDTLYYNYHDTVLLLEMNDEDAVIIEPGETAHFQERVIYQIGDIGFVLKKFFPAATFQVAKAPPSDHDHYLDAVILKVEVDGKTDTVTVFGKHGVLGKIESVVVGDVTVNVRYGSLLHSLPFALYLNEFQLERYPGSKSPSSFASEVLVLDPKKDVEKPYRIFMNNILKYNGYRFFQSSYDQDEKGTILSVNYDAPGTRVTYIGYFFMTLGMILSLLHKGSRFRKLLKASAKLKEKQKRLLLPSLILILIGFSGFRATASDDVIYCGSNEHAKSFAELQVQSHDGRIEPVNTLASELLRKISRSNSYKGLDPVQVMLEMMINPQKWQSEPIIKVSSKELQKILGVGSSYASLENFISKDEPGGYKLSRYISKAYDKPPVQRDRFDKEIITVDERVNIVYKMLSGGFLTIFPIPESEDNKWISLPDAMNHPNRNIAVIATSLMQRYISALKEAKNTGNYKVADDILNEIKDHQKKYGAEIYPSLTKTKFEIFYVNANIFSRLAIAYIVIGMILLIIRFIILLSPKYSSGSIVNQTGFWIVLLLFLVHSIGLGIRWYISGHAPWSNAYEALLYIGWASALAGLIFAKRSPMTLAVTTTLAAISLFVAGMSWMNPSITSLAPVLQSYWLIIHVAVITASYGFLGLAALLGLVNLILIILRGKREMINIQFTLSELSYIISVSIIIGLYLLTIGSFLGGVWANESWGRYWGWDPKETWALVTILVYAFITHMHKIKGLRGSFALSVAALTGFSSVLMTFFGVNYYLSGLHSYAQGDPPPIPSWIYIAIGVIALIITTAYIFNRNSDEVEETVK